MRCSPALEAHRTDFPRAFTPSGFVLERQREPRAERGHLPGVDLDVELDDFRDAPVAQRSRRCLRCIARSFVPRMRARADDVDDPIDRTAPFCHVHLLESLAGNSAPLL